MNNLKEIQRHNQDSSNSFKVDINQFTGINMQEVHSSVSASYVCPSDAKMFNSQVSVVEGSWDWRT